MAETLRGLTGCLLALTLAAVPHPATAAEQAPAPTPPQMAAAKSFFERGQALFRNGKYESAWLEFSSAYQIVQLPDLVFNMARCEAKLGRRQEAVRHYQEFLERVPNDPEAGAIRAQIEQLSSKTSEPTATSPAAREPGARESVLRRIPVITTAVAGGAVILLIAGAATLGHVGSEYGALSDRCNHTCDPAEWTGLRSASHAGYALLGLSAAAAVTAGILLPWELKKMRAERKIALTVGPGTLGLMGTF